MQGHTTHSEMNIWLLCKHAQLVEMELYLPQQENLNLSQTVIPDTAVALGGYAPVQLRFEGLLPDTVYQYRLLLNKEVVKKGTVRTLQPPGAANFSFIAGSCAWMPLSFWEDIQPGITNATYRSAAKSGADFMIWLGDDLYFRNGDWNSYAAMFARYVTMRSFKPIHPLLEAMPQYAIWDDHDFGPNNSNSANNPAKDWALQLFKLFWANPAYGIPAAPGVFYNFKYQDAEFFLLDDRYNKDMPHQHTNGSMFGAEQWNWLAEQLQNSSATFKFVVCGVQMLIENSGAEGLKEFPAEQQRFLDMLEEKQIKGVVLLSGDRHFAELYHFPRPQSYDLYEVTTSPLSAITTGILLSTSKGTQRAVPKTKWKKPNFARFNITGSPNNRICTIYLCNKKGKTVWQKSWTQTDLGY